METHAENGSYSCGARAMDRRDFLKQMSAIAASTASVPTITALASGSAQAQAIFNGKSYDSPIAGTKFGKVRGASQDGVILFKGIPYAGPPTGANRFKKPIPPEPWSGVRDALLYGAASMQPTEPNAAMPAEWLPAPSDEYCEYLNVWTPTIRDGRKRPVMLSITHKLHSDHDAQFYVGES